MKNTCCKNPCEHCELSEKEIKNEIEALKYYIRAAREVERRFGSQYRKACAFLYDIEPMAEYEIRNALENGKIEVLVKEMLEELEDKKAILEELENQSKGGAIETKIIYEDCTNKS